MWLTVTSGAPTAERIARVDDPSGLVKMAALPHAYQWTRELAAASVGAARGVRAFPDEPNIAAVTFRVVAPGRRPSRPSWRSTSCTGVSDSCP